MIFLNRSYFLKIQAESYKWAFAGFTQAADGGILVVHRNESAPVRVFMQCYIELMSAEAEKEYKNEKEIGKQNMFCNIGSGNDAVVHTDRLRRGCTVLFQ